MITVSLCMIVKNEESVLARCLDCAVQFADEIIIVDTGSTDRTVEIAKGYTDKIYSFSWRDNFAAARNYSFAKAEMEYIMWLDADDVMDEENIWLFLALKETLPSDVDAAMFKYNVGFDQDGRVTFSYYRERLVRRERGFFWREPVHEHLVLGGNIKEYDIAVTHGHKDRKALSTRNLDIYRAQEAKGEPFSSRALYYYARELQTHGMTEKAAKTYRDFLDRPDGWIEDRLCARNSLAACYTKLGNDEKAIAVLVTGFGEALPRAEACCALGEIYTRRREDGKAIFWYELALTVPRPEGWGFVNEDYMGFIPHMQLCMLRYRQGDLDKARHHHKEAKKIKPANAAVLHNEQFFT